MTKVVIVDDDADIRRIAELRLRIAGFNVLTAEDEEAGLQLIRAEKPPVVLLDLMMSKMHGFAVCQAIRSDSGLRGTFIIVTSAKSYSADIKKAKELGADLYIDKPYGLDALVGTIQKALAPSQPAIAVKFWGTRGSIPTPGRGARGRLCACRRVQGKDPSRSYFREPYSLGSHSGISILCSR